MCLGGRLCWHKGINFIFITALFLLSVADLSSIRMRVSPRTRHLVTFLIPELNKLAKAMELTVSDCTHRSHIELDCPACLHVTPMHPTEHKVSDSASLRRLCLMKSLPAEEC